MKLIELYEQVEGEPDGVNAVKYQRLTVEDAAELCLKNCSQQLELIKDDCNFIRMDSSTPAQFSLVDLNNSTRKSQNTSNHYTDIFNWHPLMKKFPSRSKSFICYDRGLLSKKKEDYIIIPFDNSKVGKTHKMDLWDLRIELFNKSNSILFFNELISILLFDAVGRYDFNDVEKDLASIEKYVKKNDIQKYANFRKEVYRAYSPKSTGLTWNFAKDSKAGSVRGEEVWIDGKVIIFPESMLPQLKEKLSEV